MEHKSYFLCAQICQFPTDFVLLYRDYAILSSQLHSSCVLSLKANNNNLHSCITISLLIILAGTFCDTEMVS